MSGISPRGEVERYVCSLPIGAEFTAKDIMNALYVKRGAYVDRFAIPHFLRTMTQRKVVLIDRQARVWRVES